MQPTWLGAANDPIFSRAVKHPRLLLAAAVAATLCLTGASAAGAATRYRTCSRTGVQTVKALPSVSCSQATRIARAGLRVDGDDGVHVHLSGRSWQCVTIKRPDHGRHTLVGCFSPSAPSASGPRETPPVTVLLELEGD